MKTPFLVMPCIMTESPARRLGCSCDFVVFFALFRLAALELAGGKASEALEVAAEAAVVEEADCLGNFPNCQPPGS